MARTNEKDAHGKNGNVWTVTRYLKTAKVKISSLTYPFVICCKTTKAII